MKNRKLTWIALMMALMLAACGQTKTEEEAKGSVATESNVQKNEVTVESSSVVAESKGTETEEEILDSTAEEAITDGTPEEVVTERASEEVIPESTPEVVVNDLSKFPPMITLSGNEADHYITTDYCCIEGDKFYLLLDKDLDLPGDFADNVAMIMDTLEEKVGLKFATSKKYVDFWGEPYKMSSMVGCYDPWADFEFGQKVPIYVVMDHDGKAWISHSLAGYTYINLPGLYSDDVCKKLGINYEYYDGYVQYDVIAHELTHVLTLRHASLPDILTEGGADYFAEETIRSLVPMSESFAKCADHFEFVYRVDQKVTEKNAETLFYNDFEDHYDQAYAFGHLLCAYLKETYGDTFMRDYIAAVQSIGYEFGQDGFWELPKDPDKKRVDEFKKLFGDDVFTNFAPYYNTHKK